MEIAIICMSIPYLLFFWALICIERANVQKKRLYDWIFEKRDSLGDRLSRQGRVSYDSHFWRLLTFRDPYPNDPELNAIAKGKEA